MLAVNGAMMKPSRSLMLTKVRFAESDSELNVYLCQQRGQVSDMAGSRQMQPVDSHPHQTHDCWGAWAAIKHSHKAEG